MKNLTMIFCLLLLSFSSVTQASQTVHIAVASNFLATLKSLAKSFTAETGIKVYISNGASGMLYNKIKRGAPYDLFFSADAKRPLLLDQEGLIVPGSRFTYVTGRLVVWSPDEAVLPADLSKLDPLDKRLRFMAIANPKTAPYGQAAVAVLKHYSLYKGLSAQQKIALGENVGKAFQYTATGNAQIGLVAKSYVSNPNNPVRGAVSEIPRHLYPQLQQQAVIIKGRETEAVKAFIKYFKSEQAQKQIQLFGYGTLLADE